MVLAVLLAKCLSMDLHMMMILCLMRQRLVLNAPTSRAMRRMLSTCDSFAENFLIVLITKNQSI